MKTGTITLSGYHINEVKADTNPEFLVFVVVEAIRNILWAQRDLRLDGFFKALHANSEIMTMEDIFQMSVNYLMDVIEENDPLFNSDDEEAYRETVTAVTDKLNLVISEISANNFSDMLEPYGEVLFDPQGENLFYSVSGTFVGNKIILCFNPTNNLFTV